MRNLKALGWLAVAVLAGCGSAEQIPAADAQFIAGFAPPAVQPGYTRFVSPPLVDIKPGTNEEYCQWITLPADQERDVLSVIGEQSRGGHHALLYASTRTDMPVGETHPCTEDDMVSFSFLGAIGGEGNTTDISGLPSGLIFRLRKGLSLVINSHYLNATPNSISGQVVLDVKFADPTPDHTVADLFANNGAGFAVEPGETASYDANCVLKQDLNFAMVTNHMHGYGISATTELIRQDGTHVELVTDSVWPPEQEFNPRYVRFSQAAPLVGHKGDTYHTRCTWKNTSGSPLAFPNEMCTGAGFYFPGNGMIVCSEGSWSAP